MSDRLADPCEGCVSAEVTKVCAGPNVEPWRLCDECMEKHREDCQDLRRGRAHVEPII